MSKMPAKKKSCFQITSVTTAQAASSITEDTESLDDPDESRTEDVSSEIFDVSRATDYGPEDVVERSSSEETLNNVGDAETPGTMSPNVQQEAPLIRSSGHPAPSQAGAQQQSGQAATPTSVAPISSSSPSAATSTAACSSRFRVIKLDHGSGEPYRRGRWTCTEFYDREPDSSSTVITRTADSIRHYEHTPERDSGLGATVGSVHVGHGPDSIADTSLTAVSQLLHPDKLNQPSQHFVIGQQPIGGAASQGAAQPLYPAAQQMMGQPGQSYVHAQSGHNGKSPGPQNVAAAQTGMSMSQQQTSASGSQPQQFTYSQAQMQSGHMMGTQVSGQADYVQHLSALQSQGSSQIAPGTGAPGSLPGQHLQAGGAQVLGLHTKPGGDSVSPGSGLVPNAPTAQSHPVHMPQPGAVAPIGGVQQKPISQQQVTGSSQLSNIPGGHHAMTPGLHNVPSTGASGITSSVPSVSATPVTMPIAPSTFVQSPLSSHTSVSRSNSLIPTVGLPPVQGTSNVHTSLPQSTISQFQNQPLAGQIDDRRKSEPLPQPPIPLISEKSFVKVPITDPLSNPLHLPVFGLPIPVDGEDDSSTSANVVAIDNKIEQAMDLVKSHLMYAVREEVEVLKEQIKELIEKNSTLERENALLKSLSNSDQLSQLSTQVGLGTCQQPPPVTTAPHTAPQTAHPPQQPNVSSA
ncbi:TSC22 domain family protein 2 isoform 2-T2 [Leptodactylus fuscus]|uniref:TSC22 domain family protein 2 isoform X2 n=1 Tax=Leptodactylus fuscus TaxID=238119 RepID=UPI003F4E9A21